MTKWTKKELEEELGKLQVDFNHLKTIAQRTQHLKDKFTDDIDGYLSTIRTLGRRIRQLETDAFEQSGELP